uniref:Pus10 N-terminal eukaryotes domain-containing protein n=1 Tax=Neolamprologus brichardi TaxID=32507 RepID=A0A3Q4GEB3_NEOBR
MLPLKEKDKPIIQKLLSAGCCARCVLRFCCVSVQAAYRKQPEVRLTLQTSKDAAESETSEDPPNKRAKLETSISDVQSAHCKVFAAYVLNISRCTVKKKGLVLNKDDVIQVKEAFKWIMQGMVTKELGGIAVVTKVSPFEVSVEFTHSETDADCHFLAATCPDCFKPTKNKQVRKQSLSFKIIRTTSLSL